MKDEAPDKAVDNQKLVAALDKARKIVVDVHAKLRLIAPPDILTRLRDAQEALQDSADTIGELYDY